MDFSKFKNVDSKAVASSGSKAFSTLHGANSYKHTLNNQLVEALKLQGKGKADGEGETYIDLQVLIYENQLAIGKLIRKDASVFRAKLSNGIASFYSTPLAHEIEKGMGYSIPKNKTVRFEQIDIETDEKGNPIAIVTCTH